ncbi:MAG: hypothetical protein ACK4M4_05530 [Flavobacterium sp.]
MSLKTLISVKFIFTIISGIIMIVLINLISNCYEDLERTNKYLLEQKVIYEEILKLDKSELKERKILYQLIEIKNKSIQSRNQNNIVNIETYLFLFMLVYFIILNSSNYLNSKIDAQKKLEID